MRKLLGLLPLLCGCSLLGKVASAAFERPKLEFKDAKLDHVDFTGADFTLTYLVTNPNSVGLNLAQTDYALQVENHALLSGKPQGGLQIPGGGSADVAFPAHVAWKDLAPAVEALFAQESVRYKASGTLGVNTPIGLIALPLEHEGTFAPPRLPDFEIQSPKILSIGLLGARLSLPLKIGNKNSFPLPLGGILGSVEIAGEKVGRVALPAQAMVEAGKETILSLPLDISFLSTGAAVASALRSRVAEVKIDGTLTSGTSTLPLHLAQTVNLTSSAAPPAAP